MELLSTTTAVVDKTIKKPLYERTFRTPEYFWCEPDAQGLTGWRLKEGSYQAVETNDRGWMWCEQLGLWIGQWKGTHMGLEATWLRFYDQQGQLVPLQAEEELRRAKSAEAEVARLQALLTDKGISPSK